MRDTFRKLLQGVNSRKALEVFFPCIVNSVHWVALICVHHTSSRENLGTYTRENLRHSAGKTGWLQKEQLRVRLCDCSRQVGSVEMLRKVVKKSGFRFI